MSVFEKAPTDGYHFMKIHWAPISVPIRRRLQTFSIAIQVFSFTVFPIICIILPIYILFFTKYWPIMAAYFCWYLADFNTPENGGRDIPLARNFPFWRPMASYFPMSIEKTVDLDPNKNYLMGYHPHGIICFGALNMWVDGVHREFKKLFPGLKGRLCMLSFWFKIPIFREYILACLLPPTKKAITNFFKSDTGVGNCAMLVPGGSKEALLSKPGHPEIILKPRLGFIKLAITNGTPLVPIFAFGENDIYNNKISEKKSKFAQFLSEKVFVGIEFPEFSGRGLFNYTSGMLPFRRPIHIVVGEPVPVEKRQNPSKEYLEEIHGKYLNNLVKVYDTHKYKYVPRSGPNNQVPDLIIN